MEHSDLFLKDLALVLCTAAVTTVVFQWLRQPVVLGYLLAGFLVGPNVGWTPMADEGTIRTLSELGVILLMFSLGLDFSLHRLVKLGPRIALVAAVEVGLMLSLGVLTGQLLGWNAADSLLAGGIVAISSTMVVASVLLGRRVERRYTDLVYGILVMEDLVAIVLLATLPAVTGGRGVTLAVLGEAGLRLGAFLVAMVVIGLLTLPRLMRAVVRLRRPETIVVASVGLSFAAALAALQAGYSVALGAFVAGSIVAESGTAKQVEALVQPVRDIFAAIFFVSVGMLIDPAAVVDHAGAVAALVAVVLVGKTLGVTVGSFLTGHGVRTSVRAGLTLAQIGEFSFIIATAGVQLGVGSAFLHPVAVAVAVATTFTTPWFVRLAEPMARTIDRRLPRPLQTFVTLYESWIELLQTARQGRAGDRRHRVRRLLVLLALDAAILGAVVIATAVNLDRWSALAAASLGLEPRMARWLVVSLAVLVALPFVAGIVRLAQRVGLALADQALPMAERGKVDPAHAPRRALIVTLQITTLTLVMLPLLAVTQPFLPPLRAPLVVLAALTALGVAFWRSATDLEGHVRAGAELVVEALAPRRPDQRPLSLETVEHMLPGLGTLHPVRIETGSAAEGRSLAQLELRGRTGATIVGLLRGEERISFPGAREVLRAGDVVALSGSHEAIEEATRVLGAKALRG